MSDPKTRDLNIAKPAPAEEAPSAEGQDKAETPKTDKAKPMAGRVSEAPYSPLKVGNWPDQGR